MRFLIFLLLALPSLAQAGDIRIGILAWLGEETAQAQWQPLAEALSKTLPEHSVELFYLDLHQLEAVIAAGEIDFVVTNPGHYVVLEARHGVTRIATQLIEPGQDSAHAVGSAVIVRSQREDLKTLDNLHGQRLAAVSAEAFGGYQVIWAELKRRDIDPENRDIVPLFTGYPMSRVIDAVRAGQADAGAIRSCLLEQLIRDGSVNAGEFRVLSPQGSNSPCQHSSPSYPGWAFAAARKTPETLSRDVLIALLSLQRTDSVLNWGVPADYHPVHEMLRELQIAPYDFLREHRLASQIHRYWPLGGAILVFMLLWLAYTLRVEVLVQRRTRELSAALSARDELEENIRAQQQQMEHLSRLSILGELSGTLAHELNQPLATIGNYAHSLTRRLNAGRLSDEAVAQAAAEIASESERAAQILESIRDFARKRVQPRERSDIFVLIAESSRLFRGMLARAPDILLDNRLGDTPGDVEVDPLQIQQVLLNLLKNAVDAHRAAGDAGLPITISLDMQGGRIRVSVRDHGIGLDEDARKHLFEPFFTTKPDGMGLGLSICKRIVEAHAGQLSAEQPPDGPGLSVSFTLPAACP